MYSPRNLYKSRPTRDWYRTVTVENFSGEMHPEARSVLVVQDEPDVADTYAAYLDGYGVQIATGGQEALDVLDKGFDVVVLDQQLPVVSSNEVLGYMETEGIGARVVMVIAANSDFDAVDLPIDDYLMKPVTRAEVRGTVDRLLKLEEYENRLRTLTSKKIERNVRQVENRGTKLEKGTEFERLNREIAELEAAVDAIARELGVDGSDI